MTVPFVIESLRTLAPVCPGGEAVLLEAAEYMAQAVRAASETPPRVLPEWQLPLKIPTR